MAPTRFRFARVQADPLKAILQRVGLATFLLLVVTMITYIGRKGYVDNEHPNQLLTFVDSLYYATVTITTTGYGDIVPVTEASRLITTIVVTTARTAHTTRWRRSDGASSSRAGSIGPRRARRGSASSGSTPSTTGRTGSGTPAMLGDRTHILRSDPAPHPLPCPAPLLCPALW